MFVVLCGSDDAGGLWLVSRLHAMGESCTLVTPDLLSFARTRSQRIGRTGVSAVVELDETTTIDSPRLVVNRMISPPIAAWQRARPAERDYATAELTAFALSWLSGLGCPVRNRADPSCLAGPAPHPLLTALHAARAGLDTPDAGFGDDSAYPLLEAAVRAAGPGSRPVHAVVLDGRLLDPAGLAARAGQALPVGLEASVERFAEAAGLQESLVGLDLVASPDRWWFGGMTPLPDVNAAGDQVVRALLRLAEGASR